MAKAKSLYVCSACGAQSYKWQGKCTNCDSWNTLELQEEPARKSQDRGFSLRSSSPPTPISEVSSQQEERYQTGIAELDRVLGGGVVPGSLTLLAGEPGVGKSTLLLQMAKEFSEKWGKVLYISGEESLQQIKMRAKRIGAANNSIYLLSENNVDSMIRAIEDIDPAIVIVDSIQTAYVPEQESAPGTIAQVRESTAQLLRLAKGENVPIFLVGHVTKTGVAAGPQVLMHMVDTVLNFTGDKFSLYRILASEKNRFGATDEIGIFEMKNTGLSEVHNPARLFLSGRKTDEPGTAIVPALEGTRPILVEIQALVTKGYGAMPRRQFSGTDRNRTPILLAVLEKRLGLPIGNYDVYINVVGGLNVTEPAADLAIALAVASSACELPLRYNWAFFGEVGLTGELRAIRQPEKRLNELCQLGFKHCLIPAANLRSLDDKLLLKLNERINIVPATNIFEAWDYCKKG
ncbi:MAG: DNA repair protein RadA [Bacillota bacterium]|nr:DNA repair protein RadA [Bacillota bacterium]HOA91808.1 DNA repair protein RadA [Bacillota bacterium]HPZ73926.1 DNA repair protein RadA [Bacillota bacterium]HQD78822.1 DNA repair protein RadA [Bacillota bacterium]